MDRKAVIVVWNEETCTSIWIGTVTPWSLEWLKMIHMKKRRSSFDGTETFERIGLRRTCGGITSVSGLLIVGGI